MFSAQFQLKYEKYLVQVGGKRPPETSFRLWLKRKFTENIYLDICINIVSLCAFSAAK